MTKKSKDNSLEFLREGFAKLPDKTKSDETVVVLKEAEIDSTNPLLKLIQYYRKQEAKEKASE